MSDPTTPKLRDNPARPGWATTEFWVTLLTSLTSVYALFGPMNVPAQTQTITALGGAIATIVYTVWRSWAKSAELDRRKDLDAKALSQATATADVARAASAVTSSGTGAAVVRLENVGEVFAGTDAPPTAKRRTTRKKQVTS